VADWSSFVIQVPGKDLLEPVRGVLEALLVFLEVLKVILETIKTFLIDFGNPIRALVEALIKLIQDLFNSLKMSGFFMYLDVPNPIEDPNFDLMRGGFDAFTARFKASLFDTKDFNRPQPRGSNQGGFVVLMVDAAAAATLLQLILRLLAFFGKKFDSPRYLAPDNFKALPVGADGDPILAAAKVFTSGPIEAIQLQWTLPSTQESSDPGFSDALQKVWNEVVPPKFLIERSTEVNPASRRINVTDIGSADAVGIVEYDRETQFMQSGQKVKKKEPLVDDSGEPVIKFQTYKVVGVPTEILGALGKFRYIDSDVEVDKDYYYRIRAYVGDLDVNESAGTVNFATSAKKDFGASLAQPMMKWPSSSSSDVVMGRPTGVVKARIPPDVGDFDVVGVLKAVFKTAFSLDFHQQLLADAKFNPDGTPLNDATPNSEVGKGSLTNASGIVSGWASTTVLSWMANYDTIPNAYRTDAITGDLPEMPWTKFLVVKQSAKLADQVATAMLQLGSDAIVSFRDLMRGSLPRGPIDVTNLKDLTTLEKVVFQFTEVEDSTSAALGLPTQEATLKAVETYAAGYADVTLRLSVLDIVKFLKSFTLGGVPPDWISIVPLRDIIPWAGGFLYELLDKIQALLDAFNGIMQEIRDFIDLLIRKIDVLEAFIQYLIDLLNFIESLEIGAYLLAVPQVSGTAADWAAAIDAAGGVRPSTGPNGFSAGVALAYVAPDTGAFVTAFSIIFGG
jgi:hypothetical protein